MTNLDSILKSRDVTLPTKVCLVKAKVFPIVSLIVIQIEIENNFQYPDVRHDAGEPFR